MDKFVQQLVRICAANGMSEPILLDAAPRMNVQYQVAPLPVRLQMEI